MNTIKRLLSEVGLPVWYLAAAVISGAITVWANVGMLATAAYLISLAALHPPLSTVTLAVTGVRFFTMVRAGFRYLERYIAHDAAFRMVSKIRVWFYKRVEPQVPSGLSSVGPAGVWQRAVADVETLQFFILRVLLPPGVAILVGIAVCLALYYAGLKFAIVTAVGLIMTGVMLPLLLKKLGDGIGDAVIGERSRLRVLLADCVMGISDLAAANRQDVYLKKVASIDNSYAGAQGKAVFVNGLGDAGGQLLMNATVLAVVVAAIPLIEEGTMDGVWLAALALAVQGAFEAVLPLSQTFPFGSESAAAAERLLEIGRGKAAVDEELGRKELPENFDIVVKNLYFRYPAAERCSLENVNFSIPQGSRVAIVGTSGAGKSTLAALLVRFWEYQGSMRLGGSELRDLLPAAVRQVIGMVPQQIHIFNASLVDNIRIANPQADIELVHLAAVKAGLGEVISSLPQGLDTFLGINGHDLSGGERQRLAIARVLLQRPSVVILDEPAASLDTETEQAVMQDLHLTLPGSTFVLISHRLAGLEDMDEILVMDAGRLVEQGNFTQLINNGGLFYQMWRHQRDIIQ